MSTKKTVIVGASPNKGRYAYAAGENLKNQGHSIIPLGIKEGKVAGENILNIYEKPEINDVDTITMYLSPEKQSHWEEYLLNLNPKRIIFNPGTENEEFAKKARNKNIEVEEACTLVMLSTGVY